MAGMARAIPEFLVVWPDLFRAIPLFTVIFSPKSHFVTRQDYYMTVKRMQFHFACVVIVRSRGSTC